MNGPVVLQALIDADLKRHIEAQADEIARLRAGLEMMTQMLTGSASWHVKVAKAILAGTDCREVDQVAAIR